MISIVLLRESKIFWLKCEDQYCIYIKYSVLEGTCRCSPGSNANICVFSLPTNIILLIGILGANWFIVPIWQFFVVN